MCEIGVPDNQVEALRHIYLHPESVPLEQRPGIMKLALEQRLKDLSNDIAKALTEDKQFAITAEWHKVFGEYLVYQGKEEKAM